MVRTKRFYSYIGPDEIKELVMNEPAGARICERGDVLEWIESSRQSPDDDGLVGATYTVDDEGWLRVADRHSEHVVCAGGKPVLSAGEIFFLVDGDDVEVAEVSNQSTGYCPEPESWPAVASALDRAGLEHPGGFTSEFVFRLCGKCGQRNIVKEGWFECAVCGAELSREWNFPAGSGQA